MAIKFITTIHRYVGASTDVKPTSVLPGSEFLEYDTDAHFVTYDGTNWVQIDQLAKLVAGEAHLGAIGGATVVRRSTPTLTVHANYASGDYVGTSGVAGVLADCARVAGGSGTIVAAALIDGALQSVAAELWLFDTAITPPTDSAAWTLSDADAAHLLPGGVIPFSTYYASALNSVSVPATLVPIPFVCGAAVKDLYYAIVTRGAPAYASGDLTVAVGVLQD